MRLAWTRGPPWRAGWSVEARRAPLIPQLITDARRNEVVCLLNTIFSSRQGTQDRAETDKKTKQRNETQQCGHASLFFFFFSFTLLLFFLLCCSFVGMCMRACFTLFVHDEVQGVQREEKKKNSLMMLYCRWGCWEPSSLVLLKNWSSETESHSRLFCVCMSSAPGALNRYNTVYFALFPYFYVPPDLKALFFFSPSFFNYFIHRPVMLQSPSRNTLTFLKVTDVNLITPFPPSRLHERTLRA